MHDTIRANSRSNKSARESVERMDELERDRDRAREEEEEEEKEDGSVDLDFERVEGLDVAIVDEEEEEADSIGLI